MGDNGEEQKRWTDEEVEYLIANYGSMSSREMAEVLGVSESSINNKLRRLRLKRNVKWSVAKIKREIQKRSAEGEDMTSSGVQQDDNQLYSAACRHFGSWTEAIEAAGLDYEVIKGRKKA